MPWASATSLVPYYEIKYQDQNKYLECKLIKGQ